MFELVYIAFVTMCGIGRREVTGRVRRNRHHLFVAATAPLFAGLNPYNLQYRKTAYLSTQYHLYMGLGVILSARGEYLVRWTSTP